MPHEAKVRTWLRRARITPEDVDDLIQESYCKLAGLAEVDHIARPDAYFFSIARNLLMRRFRRASVVSFEAMAGHDLADDRPSPEQEADGRLSYRKVMDLVDALPELTRRVVMMRKIEGRSQKEIAAALGISEGMVEWHVHKGIQAVLKAFRAEEMTAEEQEAGRLKAPAGRA
jgi:RNA polymerase sigma-70 factor (ECF subfamily)